MFKTAGAGEDHGDAIFVAGVDYFLTTSLHFGISTLN
jgi:hypothetical protein